MFETGGRSWSRAMFVDFLSQRSRRRRLGHRKRGAQTRQGGLVIRFRAGYSMTDADAAQYEHPATGDSFAVSIFHIACEASTPDVGDTFAGAVTTPLDRADVHGLPPRANGNRVVGDTPVSSSFLPNRSLPEPRASKIRISKTAVQRGRASASSALGMRRYSAEAASYKMRRGCGFGTIAYASLPVLCGT